jgi:predicted nucleotidyltransferase
MNEPLTTGGDQIRSILDDVLESIPAAHQYAVYLEGSIAEGFGNSTSDVDFVLIDPAEQEYPVMPTLMFLQGRRVEVRMRSSRTLKAQLDRVREWGLSEKALPPKSIDEEVLDRCQRFVNGKVFSGAREIEILRANLPQEALRAAISKWFLLQCRGSHARASLCLALGRLDESEAYARAALTEAAKACLALHGETYLAKKWISKQFDRQPQLIDIKNEFETLELNVERHPPDQYLREVTNFVRNKLVDIEIGQEKFSIQRSPGVTTWRLGSRLHVLRGDFDLFALSGEAERVWRCCRFGESVLQVISDSSAPGTNGRKILFDFFQLGLIQIHCSGIGNLHRRAMSLPPSAQRPFISIDGLSIDEKAGQSIHLAPMPARRFVACGMELAYVNMVIENAREDAAGACSAKQWKVVERAARRMLRNACLAVLSAHGVHPLPTQEEACAATAALDSVPESVVQLIADLDGRISVYDQVSAAGLLRDLEAAIELLRKEAGAGLFPKSFMTNLEWAQTLSIGYDWARLGAYLDADFPIDQARELISSGSRRA